jgi:translation initiation factor 4E
MCSETIKRILAFPADTNIVWKSHDDSIAQRSALDEARQQKVNATSGHAGDMPRRRPTLHDEPEKSRGKAVPS